jgi:hypothetical protein
MPELGLGPALFGIELGILVPVVDLVEEVLDVPVAQDQTLRRARIGKQGTGKEDRRDKGVKEEKKDALPFSGFLCHDDPPAGAGAIPRPQSLKGDRTL